MSVRAEQKYRYRIEGLLPPQDASNEGLFFNDIAVPEEILTLILSYVDAQHLLRTSLVCKTWCEIIRKFPLWSIKYKRRTGKEAKLLPWYIYYCYFSTNFFDVNLLRGKCCCGTLVCKSKMKTVRSGNTIDIFITNDIMCATRKIRKGYSIDISERNNLLQFIFKKYKPHIYVKEVVNKKFGTSAHYCPLELIIYSSKAIVCTVKINSKVVRSSGPVSTRVCILSVVNIRTLIIKRLLFTQVVTCIDKYEVGEDPISCIDFKKWICDGRIADSSKKCVKVLFDTIEPEE